MVMKTQRKPKAASASVNRAELAFAAPQVIARRLTRMALDGPALSARDRPGRQAILHGPFDPRRAMRMVCSLRLCPRLRRSQCGRGGAATNQVHDYTKPSSCLMLFAHRMPDVAQLQHEGKTVDL